jgi:hypothetical protein
VFGRQWEVHEAERYMHDLQAVLSLPQEAMYLALGDHLARRFDAVGLHRLTTIERTLWLAREFHWTVRQSGLLGYMVVATPATAHDTQIALATIGAGHTAAVLGGAMSAHEKSGVGLVGAPVVSEEFDDLPLLICQYARANRDELLVTGLTE